MAAIADIAFVLFRPQQAGNIGAAARALRNMGLRDLRLVAPAASSRSRAAHAMAVHGDDVLAATAVHPDLKSALADRTIVAGTTCRRGLYRSGAIALRDAARELADAAATNRIAIVFGPEDHGLANRELKLCHRLITIPTAPEYPSLNLAQAVMLVAYEMMLALAAPPRDAAPAPELAPAPEVAAMFERMKETLVAIGFLPAENPDHIMFALREIFGRSGIRPRELEILNGITSQIRWAAGDGHRALAEKRRAGMKLR
ncbi:MAG TPA: TrmJ/YjtD family RNA methyltransferase [Candidatus Binataceae bacterium]|nr:TrmJ/YjtD family RNA methyltransferase [Candidatus Binataceae bacterium]